MSFEHQCLPDLKVIVVRLIYQKEASETIHHAPRHRKTDERKH